MSIAADQTYSGTELEALTSAVNYRRWVLSQFESYLGSTVAEVGAGIGSVSSDLLQDPSRRIWSFEPSQNMFPALAAKLAGETRALAINDFFNPALVPQLVDSVVYINVMEHIEDHAAETSKAYQALRSGGHLLIFVPALQWLYSDFDREIGHFRRYTKKMLVDLATNAGFEIVKAKYFDVAGILPWYVTFVLLRGRPGNASVTLYDKVAVPPMRILESIVAPPIGKNVLIVARKP